VSSIAAALVEEENLAMDADERKVASSHWGEREKNAELTLVDLEEKDIAGCGPPIGEMEGFPQAEVQLKEVVCKVHVVDTMEEAPQTEDSIAGMMNSPQHEELTVHDGDVVPQVEGTQQEPDHHEDSSHLLLPDSFFMKEGEEETAASTATQESQPASEEVYMLPLPFVKKSNNISAALKKSDSVSAIRMPLASSHQFNTSSGLNLPHHFMMANKFAQQAQGKSATQKKASHNMVLTGSMGNLLMNLNARSTDGNPTTSPSPLRSSLSPFTRSSPSPFARSDSSPYSQKSPSPFSGATSSIFARAMSRNVLSKPEE